MTSSKPHRSAELRMIPIGNIEVLNTRERNHRVFQEIVGNIRDIGLKKPITVTPRPREDGAEHYQLICGEGRLKAYKALNQDRIPALVVKVDTEEAYIMSLTENIARRKFHPVELLAGIGQLLDQGYDKKVIAEKTGLSVEYVQGVLYLLKNGEERLLVAVESGRIPLHSAMTIAGAGNDDKAIQAALQDAYESGKLRGSQLIQARRVIEHRRTLGRSLARHASSRKGPQADVTPSSLVRSYQREVERQKQMIKKAEFAQRFLLFVVGALHELLSDENFSNLLRAEGLDTLPQYLADRVWPRSNA